MTPRKTLRIARWEVASAAGEYDRRTAILAIGALLVVGALVPAAAAQGFALDEGIYTVGVDESSPYYGPVAADPAFTARQPDRAAFRTGSLDLLVTDRHVLVRDDRQSRAAAAALGETVEAYNDRLMAAEADQAAAFPVRVRVRYVEREVATVLNRAGGTDAADPTPEGSARTQTEGDAGGATDGSRAGSTATGPTGTPDGTATPAPAAEGNADGNGGLPGFGGASALTGQSTGSPSDIAPPFPFASLVLAFAFLLPMNFVVQAYGSSVLRERLNRRGEAMLVAPVSRGDIIAGKTLPYLAAMLAIAGVTALLIGGGLVAIAAVTPVALVFLAATFLGALLSRSFKELTFVTVAISVVLSAYVFVPAIFTTVHPVAAISPLTLVVKELEGVRIGLGEYVFSTGTFFLAGVVMYGIGAGLYREEDLFTQRPLREKAIDALAFRIHRPASAALLSALSIPFVLFAELFAVALLFALPVGFSLPAILVVVAVIEEGAKSGHVVAGIERGKYPRALRATALVGGLSGVGFFLGEKLAVVTQLVGLPDLVLGKAAFGAAGIAVSASPLLVAGLLLAPLALHVVTAVTTATAAGRGTRPYLFAYGTAVCVHVVYNLAVVKALG